MNVIKKLSVGAWITLAAAVLAIVSLIVYAVNIGSAGYFQNAAVSNVVPLCLLSAAALVAAALLGQLELSGPAAAAVEVVVGALQICAPVLLTLCLANLAAARAEGLSFIFLSNADVILEVQTPANMASATGTIANMACLGAAMLAGLVGAFCGMRKKAR